VQACLDNRSQKHGQRSHHLLRTLFINEHVAAWRCERGHSLSSRLQRVARIDRHILRACEGNVPREGHPHVGIPSMSRFSNVLLFSSEDPYNASVTENGIPRFRVRSTRASFMNEVFGAFEVYDVLNGVWGIMASIHWDVDGDKDMVLIMDDDEVAMFNWERTFSLQ
jgi:hypothetical protein